MNKKEKQELYLKLNHFLKSFYEQNGFKYIISPFSYEKNGAFVFWGAAADYVETSQFQPWFRIENNEINKIFKTVFPNRIAYHTSSRTQNTIEFAHEFGIQDFDNRPYNHCMYGVCTYFYDIGLNTDLEPIIKDHIEFMEKVTFPYFDKLSTVKGISDYFNDRLLKLSDKELKNTGVMRSFQKEEILSSIIASYLEKEERLNKVIETYKKLYSISEFYLNDINLLDNWIKDQNATT